MLKRRVLALLPMLTLFACTQTPEQTTAPASEPETASGGQTQIMLPPATDPADATIKGIYDHPIMLIDGVFEGQPFEPDSPMRPRVTMIPELTFEGNLDADDQPETVIVLVENSGGTGQFFYLAVLDRSNGEYTNIDTATFGDRVDIRDARIDDKTIVLEIVQAGPQDGACCPTQLATYRWTLENGQLQEQPVNIEGTLSLEALRGTTWRLVKFGYEGEPIEDVEATLSFTEEGVAGSAGCNQFYGQAEAGEQPGHVRIGPLVSTKMLCGDAQMSVENRYLPKLEAATQFEFHNGFLLLSHPGSDEPAPLVFERVTDSATD